jgi:hypothetical protein
LNYEKQGVNTLKKEDMSFGMSKFISILVEDTHVIIDDQDGLDEPKEKNDWEHSKNLEIW